MAAQTRKLIPTSRAALGRILQQILTQFERLKTSSKSADYQAWQQQFMWRRVSLVLWVVFPCYFTITARDFYGALFYLQELANTSEDLKAFSLLEDAIGAVLLFACLMLHRTKWGHRYPAVVFLCISWSITLTPQVLGTLKGLPDVGTGTWILVFLTQATLMPVRWWLHLVSQLAPLIYYVGVNLALGWTTSEGYPLFSASLFLYLFWLCSICDLGVYLHERLQQAEFESRRELRVFLHAISHNLRTPVMGTSIVLQNLLKKSQSQVSVNVGVLERLLQGNSHQLKLINSLLEAHTYEVGGVELHCKPLQLRSLLASVLSDLEPLMTQNLVILKNLVSADLPLVNADAAQIRQVFSNLIINALEHNPQGITLTLNASVKTKMMCCHVQDNGVGMSSQHCNRVFDLYTRGESARFIPGLGLGLYVCRHIIVAHGGEIGVTSYLGVGSAFWFTLPLHVVE